jgi:hypothetical protein
MYEQDGIVYADNPMPLLTVKQVHPLDNHTLFVQFSTGEEKEVDISSLLDEPVFQELRNPDLYKDVYVDYGTVVWCNGTIDIAPEYLYSTGVPVKKPATNYQ